MAGIEAIQTTYLEADATSITFSSIPSTYEHLQLRASPKDSGTGNYSVTYGQFNSDGAGNYTHQFIYWYSTTKAGNSDTGAANWRAYLVAASDLDPPVPEEAYGTMVVDILDYANANKNTTFMYNGGGFVSDQGSISHFASVGGGVWDNTAAVDTVLFAVQGPPLRRGTVVTLYGLKNS